MEVAGIRRAEYSVAQLLHRNDGASRRLRLIGRPASVPRLARHASPSRRGALQIPHRQQQVWCRRLPEWRRRRRCCDSQTFGACGSFADYQRLRPAISCTRGLRSAFLTAAFCREEEPPYRACDEGGRCHRAFREERRHDHRPKPRRGFIRSGVLHAKFFDEGRLAEGHAPPLDEEASASIEERAPGRLSLRGTGRRQPVAGRRARGRSEPSRALKASVGRRWRRPPRMPTTAFSSP